MTHHIKIFIVEDELIAAESLIMDLKQLGYQVVGKADSADKVFDQILKNQPDLILMDINIKGKKTGIDVANELNKYYDIPIIYLTAYADEKTLEQASLSSPYGYIVKPYKIQDLQSSIFMALTKFKDMVKVQKKLEKTQQKLNYFITNDTITNLPNQLSLVENFQGILEYFYQTISFQETEKTWSDNEVQEINQLIPIFYISLDRFNLIREELGNDVANFLLRGIAERLKKNVNQDSLISRLEGDEFALILPPIQAKQVAMDLAQILLVNISKSFIYNKQEIFIDLSIGISFYPIQGKEINQLLINAKKALRQYSNLGGNQYQVYSPVFHSHTSNQMLMEADLHHALDRNQLELYYQPQVDLKTGKVFGSEALLRWKHHEKGFISPGVFIPIAEETGLIEEIGEWVLKTACNQTSYIHKKGFSNLTISVNISARQFNNSDLIKKLGQILAITAFPSKYLDLELTESILIHNPSVSKRKLDLLKGFGVNISIDDFGTGYSSLGYLQNFSFDVLKIDRCFIKDIHIETKNSAITKSLINLSHQLNLKVIAEGVEKEAELNFLKENNCDAFQGYLFSRPLCFSDFEVFLNKTQKNFY